uniref:Gamma-tubulin complex component n=1 Tax=Ditylenchus dipsaci TaxID=166011 RepID=A0A915CMI3_9BILA
MPFDNETCFFSVKKVPEDPIELREIDLAYELCNMMLPHQRLPKCFAIGAAGEYRLSDEYKVEGKCSRFSSSYIPNMISKFSECREKLQEIRILVESPPSSHQLVSMFVQPIKIVLRKFLDDSVAAIHSLLITSQDLVNVSNFLIDFQPRLEKTHAYFGSVLRIGNNNDYLMESAAHVWDKFVLDLAHSGYLAVDLPIWVELCGELVSLLGHYFNQFCENRELSIAYKREPVPGAVRQPFHPNFNSSREESQYARSTYSESSVAPSDRSNGKRVSLFKVLWTEKLREDLLLAIRYSKNVHFMPPMSFLEVYGIQLDELKRKGNSDYKIGFLKELLMRSAAAYKAQFADSILSEICCNDRIGVILSEIKELYTLRAFCRPLSDFFQDFAEVGITFDQMLKSTLLDVQLYCMNSKDSAMGEERGWKITLLLNGDQPWKFELSCQIAWPLSCVLDDNLMDLLNKCLELCQEIFRAYAISVKLLRKGSLQSVSLVADGESRKKRLLLHSSMRSLATIYSVMQTHIEQLITKTRMQLVGCKSLAEVDKCIHRCKESLDRILNYDDLEESSYIHPMIYKLCEMVPKIYDAETEPSAKNTRNVEKYLKVLGRILIMLQSDPLAPGPESVGQEIAARLPRSPSVYKH